MRRARRVSLEVTVESVAPRVEPRWYLALSRQCRAPPSPESTQAVLRVVGLSEGWRLVGRMLCRGAPTLSKAAH